MPSLDNHLTNTANDSDSQFAKLKPGQSGTRFSIDQILEMCPNASPTNVQFLGHDAAVQIFARDIVNAAGGFENVYVVVRRVTRKNKWDDLLADQYIYELELGGTEIEEQIRAKWENVTHVTLELMAR